MGSSYIYYPKKDGTVRFISEFREFNKGICRKPYPITKIQELLLWLEGFKYRTSLNLNMGYYHIKIIKKSKEDCMITTQWGKYEYPNGYLKLAIHISGENVMVNGWTRNCPHLLRQCHPLHQRIVGLTHQIFWRNIYQVTDSRFKVNSK